MARASIRSPRGRKQHAAAALAAVDQPVNSVLPAITGTKTVGQTLTGTTGTWTKSPAFARQWLRFDSATSVGSVISGATASTYVLQAGDSGKLIAHRVLATANGITREATSAQTTAIAP